MRQTNWATAKTKWLTICICMALFMALAGCGSFEQPVMQLPTNTPQVEIASDSATQAATMPPTATATPLPPTATPTPLPPTATPEPTAIPEPTSPPQSPIDRLVAVRNAENGAALFNTFQDAANYSCANCHSPDSEKKLIGPGLLNIKDRAAQRAPEQSPAEYIYQSIVDTNAYVVEGYEAGLMPANWAEIYSDLEIFDIVAYLLTLEGRSDIDDPDPADAASAVDMSVYGEIALPDTADAERGAALFSELQSAAGFACAGCHFTDSESRLIGPGLLNVGARAETRVEGQSAVEYLLNAIVNPSAYVVPDYDAGLKPGNYAQIFSEAELYDIIAYLLTLE